MSSISFQIPEPGIWTVTGEFGGQIVTQRINITDKGSSTPVALTFSSSTITVTSPVGTSLLLTDGTNQITAISTGTNVFTIYNMGQWTVSGTLEGYTLNSVTVNVAAGQNYPVELEIKSATLTVTAPVGTLVSVVGGGDTQEVTATNGTAVFQLTTLASYQVSGTLNGLASNAVTVDVTAYQPYTATLTIESASIVVTTLDDVLVTAQNGNITLTDTAVNGQVTFQTQTFGEWTISGTLSGYTFTPQTADVQAYQQYDVSLQPLVATITVTAPNGTEIVAENSTGEQVQGFAGQGTAVLDIYSLDTWTVSGTQNGLVTNSVPVQVADWTNYPVNLTIWAATITVTTPTGTLVTAQNGNTQIQATASNDQVIFAVQITGNWAVSAQFDTQSDSEIVDIQAEQDYPVRLWVPTIVPTIATGSVVTCTQGQTVLTKTSQSGKVKFYVPSLGEWTLNATLNQQSSNTVIVDVQEDRDYPLLLNYTFATITVATVAGTEITAQNGGIIITQTANSNGEAVFEVATFGTWTISADFDGELVSSEVEVIQAINYDVEIKPTPTAPDYVGTAAPLSVARRNLAAAAIGNYALFAGGYAKSYSLAVDVYNSSLTRTTTTSLSQGRYSLSATIVGNYALFAGGYAASYSAIVDAYNSSLTRSTANPLTKARSSLSGAHIGDYALFAGGYAGSYSLVVDAYNNSLTRTTATSLSQARGNPSAANVGDYALFGGGVLGANTGSSVVDVYNASLTRIDGAPLSSTRNLGAAASVGDYALFGGGRFTNTVDSYNTSLIMSIATPLSQARGDLGAASIENYALFAGGSVANSTYSDVVDTYNNSLTLNVATPLSQARNLPASVRLNNYALFGGGLGSSLSDTVDVYK